MPSLARFRVQAVRLLTAVALGCALLAFHGAADASAAPAGAKKGAPKAKAKAKAKACRKAKAKVRRAPKSKALRSAMRRACGKPKRRGFRPRVGDVDGDGVPNDRDMDIDGDGIPNGRDPDIDGDRLLNPVDPDMDADLASNGFDRDIDADRRLNKVDPDADADTKYLNYDHDIDSDGLANAFDDDSDASGDALVGTSGVLPSRPGFVGLTADDAFWGTDADPSRAGTMGAVAAVGASTVRHPFLWSVIEPSPGRWDFALHDEFVLAAARQGLSVLPVLFDPPTFRSSRPASGAERGVYPPADNDDFATFAAALVRRYGPGGRLWREHPALPERPIRAWQIWNEPNIPFYWPAGPNPAAYTALLQAGSAAIRAVDPGATIVNAGLNDSELGLKLVPFLQGMYAAGARDSFDQLAVHPYAPASDLVVDQLSAAVRELERAGDDARVLVTELGWATGGPAERALVVGEAGQAALIRSTTSRLSRLADGLRLDGMFYFNWRDVGPAPGARDHWGLHTGLLRQDGSPKPALEALQQAARG